MKKFDFVFGAILGEMILHHFDNLSQCFQKKTGFCVKYIYTSSSATTQLPMDPD